jgi:predicted nucleotidyltransferase
MHADDTTHDTTMNDDLAATLTGLCEEHGLVAMYVFGSRADEIAERVTGREAQAADAEAGRTGQTRQPTHAAHPESDVDIGVQPRRDRVLSAADRVGLMQQLETLLDAARVDLVILPEANAFLAADVVRGELLAATDLDAESDAQLYYLRRAADLAPFLREQWREKVGSEL